MGDLRRSYVHGVSDTPLLGQTIGEALAEAVAQWPDREALVVRHQDIRWTWRELADRVEAFAAGLIALGLEPGDRIGIWSPNTAEWVVTQFAAARAGLILVNINPAYRLTELEYALTKVRCKALVTACRFKTTDYIAMLCELAPELLDAVPGQLRAVRLPDLRIVICAGEGRGSTGAITFDAVPRLATDVHRKRLAESEPSIQFDAAVNIQFTSGTTGSPKGATLTHHNILNNGYFTARALKLSHDDRLCIPVPLYHCFGMVMGNLACVTAGATIVYATEGFDAGAVLETVAAERCTALYGVPTMFIALLDHPARVTTDLSSLRTGIMAGAPCPIEVMKRVVTELHMPEVTIAYGMTETSPVSFQTASGDSLERRVSTVGRVHPHVEVKIVDAEGRTVPCGVPGELCTRGYSVMLGYWDDAERTREAIDRGGWMHTGDLAVVDVYGYCNIVGRIKDLVIRGGENVYPREVEEFLHRHPGIMDVQVIGVPDSRFGEELCAWIRTKPGVVLTAEAIRTYCEGQVAHFKIPRYIKFVDSYPMTVTGKVQKFVMREQMTRELALVDAATA